MFFYLLQSWLLLLICFAVGALIAWFLVRTMYRPIADVRADLAAEVRGDKR